MRALSLGNLGAGTPEARLRRIEDALREIERASYVANTIDLGAAFSTTGTLTETRSFDVGTGTLDDVRTVLATLLADMKRGGAKRTA
jgi:hypothetical protein